MRRFRRFEWLAFALVVVAGGWLRWVHLGTPSLWWDELVEIRTATVGGLGDVLREVRLGIPPGSGNAGAMPLDYVLLHAFLRWVPLPTPAHLEAYFRFPAFLYGVAALVVVGLFVRRFFDPEAALLATLLLALSLPHVLYAAEVRFYALFVLATLGTLWAFGLLLERPDARRAWAGHLVAGVLCVLTGLYGLLLVGLQYLVLAVVLLRRRDRTRLLAAWIASGAVLGLVVTTYLTRGALGVQYTRAPDANLAAWSAFRETIGFFAIGNPGLVALALLAVVGVLLSRGERGPGNGALVGQLLASGVAVPVIVVLARWKHYYFHPRHALFLLPAFVIVTAFGTLSLLRRLDPFVGLLGEPHRRRSAELVAVALIVVGTQAPVVRAYLAHPETFFARTKTLHDMHGLVGRLAADAARLGPDARFVILAERQSMPNAALSLYLRWYGLDRQVSLRGTADVQEVLAALARPGATPDAVAQSTFVRAAVGLTPDFRRLLGVETPVGVVPNGARQAVVLAYSSPPPAASTGHFVRRTYVGFTTFEWSP